MADKLFGTVKAGQTSISLYILLNKTSDGTELTGIASGSVTASYLRTGGSRTAITVAALASATAAFSAGGWFEIDATNMPGLYRFDVPDAAWASGAEAAFIGVKVATAFVYYERFNIESVGSAEVYARQGAPAGASIAADIAAIPTGVWAFLATAATTVGSLGKRIADNLDVAVSSRSTYAGADTSGTTTLLSRLTSGRATNLDNLDAAVSSRSTYAGADTAGTTTLLSRLTSTRAGLLDNLDAAITSRLSAASYTAPDNANIATLVGRVTAARALLLDNLTQLDAAITSRASAADYTPARAAKLDNLDATVSSRSTYTGGDTAGTTTLLARLTAQRATNLDYLDVAVSSRSAYGGGDTSGITTLLARVTAQRAGLWDNLSFLDASILSRASENNLTGLALITSALPDAATVQARAAAALTAYDPPTRAEATTDKQEVLTAIGQIEGGEGSGLTAQQVWEYTPRTLTSGGGTGGPGDPEAVWDTERGTEVYTAAQRISAIPGPPPVIVAPAPTPPSEGMVPVLFDPRVFGASVDAKVTVYLLDGVPLNIGQSNELVTKGLTFKKDSNFTVYPGGFLYLSDSITDDGSGGIYGAHCPDALLKTTGPQTNGNVPVPALSNLARFRVLPLPEGRDYWFLAELLDLYQNPPTP